MNRVAVYNILLGGGVVVITPGAVVVVPGMTVVVSIPPSVVVVTTLPGVVVSTPASGVVSSTDGDGVVSAGHDGYLPHLPLTRSAPDSAHEHSSMLQSSIGKQSPSFPHPKVQLHLSGQTFGGMVTS